MKEINSKFSEQSKILEDLGNELTKIQYDFKIKESPSEKYWNKRIEEFDNYHKKSIEYFSQAYILMKNINNEQSGLFILRLSKLKELGTKLLENMEKVQQNPSIMNPKDKQQSKWSIEQKEKLINSNQDCLNHERKMNIFFREFFENNLK